MTPPDLGWWPEAVRAVLSDRVGRVRRVEDLAGGQTGARVAAIVGERGAAVLKVPAPLREIQLYATGAESLRCWGVSIPACYAHGGADGGRWVMLEYVRSPWPWTGHDLGGEPVAALARLHQGGWGGPALTPDPYVPAWPRSLSVAAAELWPEVKRPSVRQRMEAVRSGMAALFTPLTVLSGDPNPTNWRRRHNGVPVLLDWERAGMGHPAVDLAISLPGLPLDDSPYRVLAARYRAAWVFGGAWDIAALTRDIRAAKLFVAVEYLGMVGAGRVAVTADKVEALRGRVEALLDQAAHHPLGSWPDAWRPDDR